MKARANPAYAIFRKRLAAQRDLLRPWKGAGYRVTTLDYPQPASILSGEGSFRYGGRWNAPGSFRAVYGSTVDAVAVAESRANAEYARMPYPLPTPRLLVTIEFDLRDVLDLSEEGAAARLGLDWDELAREDWRQRQATDYESETQAIGRALFDSGANALLAPSARVPDGINIVYFPENRWREGEARVCEPEALGRIRGRGE